MSVRWTDEQLQAMKAVMHRIEVFKASLVPVDDKVLDAFGDSLPKDLIAAHSQMHEGMSKLRMIVDFQEMIRKDK